MAKQGGFSGVIAPVLTPFGEDGNPDAGRFVDHAHWLMQEGCTGLAPFGTTSEANSLGLDERMELLEELVDDGIDAATLMPGTGTCSLADTIMLTRHAMDLSCGGVLMLPPFYYKGPSEEGLFRFFAEAIEGVGDDKLKVYLYHIPPVAQVGFSLPLIGRLIKAFPDNVVGLKDFLRRLEQHRGDPRGLSEFRGVPRLRDLPARRLAQGRSGLHLGDVQRQCRAPSAMSTTTGRPPMPTACRPASPRCARRSRPIR